MYVQKNEKGDDVKQLPYKKRVSSCLNIKLYFIWKRAKGRAQREEGLQ